MKILSKYKDYYDYLTGIYGVDPKLVLDRRKGARIDKFRSPGGFSIAICGNLVQGFYDGEKCYCGDSLLKVGEEVEVKEYFRGIGFQKEKKVKIKYTTYSLVGHIPEEHEVTLYREPQETDLNEQHDCPILLVTSTWRNDYEPFPRLEDYGIGAVYSPNEMFTMLSSWLSQKITEAENIVDTRSDEMKLESKGFNKKCSFRPKMKTCN